MSLTFSFSSLEFQVKELDNDSCFTVDTNKWSASSLRTGQNMWSTCSGTYLLGGYGVIGPDSGTFLGSFFSRTYTNLASHTMLYFSVTMWAIDSWNFNADFFQIQFDSATPISGWKNFDYSTYPSYITNLCGDSGYRDVPNMRLFGRAVHSGGSLIVKFISQFDQVSTNEAFGIRNFNILFTPNPTTIGATSYFCGIASIPINALLQCSCPEGQYLDSTSTCVNCDGACVSCFGPGANQCYECQPNYVYDGNTCYSSCTSPCTNCRGTTTSECSGCITGYVLYDLSTCILPVQCVWPLSVTDCTRSCDSPCPRDQFVYANLSCSANCIFPLQQGLVLTATKLCIYPCSPGQYLYWDGQCEADCVFPLAQRFQPGETYCDYLCAITDYLYWNGTCASSCPAPLVSVYQRSRNFCVYPCSYYQYLYPDSTCKMKCRLPYASRVEALRNYCYRLCPGDEYVLWNGGCIARCDFPFRITTNISGTFCNSPCDDPTDYYFPASKTCSSTCDALSETINNLYKVCYVKEMSISKLLHHIRYVKVEFPDKIKNLTVMRGTNDLSLRVSASMFKSIGAWQNKFTLPSVFEYYLMPSSFLANFSNDLILLGLIIACTFIIFVFEQILATTDLTTLRNYLQRIRVITQFNLPLMIIASNTGDIFLFAVNEFRTYDSTAENSFLSFALAVVMLFICAAFYILGFTLIYKAQLAKDQLSQTGSYKQYFNFVISWQHCQVLFRGYDDTNFFSQSFFMIYCIRTALPMIITSCLYNVPLLQSISFVLITNLMLVYLLYSKPIKKTIDLANLVILELLILFADISLLVLNIFDIREVEAIKARNFFGDVILISDKGLSVLAGIALLVKIMVTIRIGYKLHSQDNQRQKKLVLMQLFWIPIQQGFFGFEQVQVERFTKAPEKPTKATDGQDIMRLNETTNQHQRSNLHNQNRLELTTNMDRDYSFVQETESSPIRANDSSPLRQSRVYPPYQSGGMLETGRLKKNDNQRDSQNSKSLRRHRK